jgi:hypothetical protein
LEHLRINQGNNKPQIIANIEDHFFMYTALDSGIVEYSITICHDIRCYFCYLQRSHKNWAPTLLVEFYILLKQNEVINMFMNYFEWLLTCNSESTRSSNDLLLLLVNMIDGPVAVHPVSSHPACPVVLPGVMNV